MNTRLILSSLALCALAPAQNLVANLNTSGGGQPSSGLDPFFVVGGIAVFDGGGQFGSEPYVTDGTPAGTFILADLMPAGGSNPKDLPAPLAAIGGVRPGSQPVRVEIGPQQHHTSWLRGTIRLGEGSLSRDSVLVRRIGEVGWRRYRSSVAVDGAFQVGPMPEGRYLVRVDGQSGAFGPFAVAGSMVAVGELEVDEELLTNRPGFNRQVALVYPAGVPLAQWAFIEVRDHKGRVVVAKTHPGSLSDLSELYVRLPEGHFTLRVTTKQGYEGACDVAVDANKPPRRAVVVSLSRS